MGPPNVPPPPLPLSRRLLFGFVALVILPLLALGLLELVLRVSGFGHPTSFLVRREIHGKAMLVENPWFGLRFFPPALARSPNPIAIAAHKPAGVYRIFLFGESAALGDPRPAYGVGRYLETLLRERFPGVDFEVVCVAVTAINSHAILPLARECTRYQGDLWILYMGNNEFYGPFGAGTVFGSQAPPNRVIRAYLALQRARVGQWLVSVARKLPGGASPRSWGGLKMFLEQQLAPSDPRKPRVYESFRENLEDILHAGTRSGVPILLSRVASNLKDCAPLGSLHIPALAPSEKAEWDRLCQAGITNAAQGLYAEAITNYQAAGRLSPRFAELHFRVGQCFLALTNFESARQSFVQARDLDTLPFRADSTLNRIILDTAARYSNKGVTCVDAEKALAPLNSSRIPGQEAFYEHVHLNPDGNYWLARAFAEEVLQHPPVGFTNRPTSAWADPPACAQALGLTDWNRFTILEEVGRRLAEAPFANQFDNAIRREELRAQMDQLKARMLRPAARSAQASFEAALQKRPGDHWLHHNYAEFLTVIGDLPQATGQMESVRDLLPHHHAAYFQLGRLLARQGKYDQARQSLLTALRLRPDVAEVYVELGQLDVAEGKLDQALTQFAAAQRLHEDDARVCLLRANVFERQNKRGEAIRSLREAIRLRPSYWEAQDLLGVRLALEGNFPEAQAAFEEVVRLRPDNAEAQLNLGIALARQQKLQAALEHLQKALELDPRNQRAREFIEAIQQARKL